ncbi:MAG: protein kinase domain-containing protein [Gemmatimonadaceae bacterium]
MSLGTPAYMSPEQASGEPEIGGRSDLYALGCVTHELLAGSPPFAGKNAMATISQHITKAPPALVGIRDRLSDDVTRAVSRMLAKDPADRFGTAAAFASILETSASANRVASPANQRLRARERAAEGRKSVFVIDFTNIADAPDLEWLSSGIAETVTVDLGKIAGIRVVGTDLDARRRVAAARQSGSMDAETARELARPSGAKWVVWGAFQKVGTRIRLTPQFADVVTGETISSEKIDGDVEDIFELQDRIVTRLAEILRVKLTSGEVEQIARPQTRNLGAYELYARGKQAFQLFGRESAEAAAGHFRQAIALDPDYALAWAGLGSLLMPRYIASGDPRDLEEGVRALQRAIELDPALGEPYAFLSYMYLRQHRFDEATVAARTAIEREPGNHIGWYLLGISFAARGLTEGNLDDLAAAVPPLLRCRALNPMHHPAQMCAAALYMVRGQYGHAISVLDEAVAVERNGVGLLFLGSYVQRAFLHLNSGEAAAAVPLLQLAIGTYPGLDHVYAETMAAYAYVVRGYLAERQGDMAAADGDFTAASEIAEAHDHRLGIGSHWLKARLGLARIAYRNGDRARSARLVDEVAGMRAAKTRFVWSWILGASEADTLYDLAATHAVREDPVLAIAALEEAIAMGWSDAHQLSHDVNFTGLRDSDTVRQLVARATSLVTLPPPVDSGGLPDAA